MSVFACDCEGVIHIVYGHNLDGYKGVVRMSRSLLLVAVTPNKAHKHRRSLVDQQIVHSFLNLLLVQGRRGVHICVVLGGHVRPPPVWTLRLRHMV